MIIDVRHLNRYVNQNPIEHYYTVRSLAKAAIEYAKVDTNHPLASVYTAYTHMATIPEMDLSLSRFDYMIYTPCDELPIAILEEAEEFLDKLDLVIAQKALGIKAG